jgi:NADH-quinone oxidoreductase subunit J
MIDSLVLYLFAALALAGAALMLVLRHPMRVALALITTMLALGGIYGLLGVHAIAVFQILIYVSAVMVFIVYVIMLLDVRDISVMRRYSRIAAFGVAGFAALVVAFGYGVWQGATALSAPGIENARFGLQAFSAAFLNDYWLYFELISVLLVAAVVGALAVMKLGLKPRG